MPLQFQNMIVENLSTLHSDTEMAKIKTDEDSLTIRLRDELIDSTNLTKGTVFDNIIKINEKMYEKLKVRVDLRTASAMAAGHAPLIYATEEERQ